MEIQVRQATVAAALASGSVVFGSLLDGVIWNQALTPLARMGVAAWRLGSGL